MNDDANLRSHRARSLRRTETDPEYRLWYELRGRRLNGYKFVRQVPVGPYFADFACRIHWLIVELDGGQHAESKSDEARTAWLNGQGYAVLRFWNEEVMRELDAVLETILGVLDRRITELSTGVGPSSGLRFAPATFSPQGRRMEVPSAMSQDTPSSPLRGGGPGRTMRGSS